MPGQAADRVIKGFIPELGERVQVSHCTGFNFLADSCDNFVQQRVAEPLRVLQVHLPLSLQHIVDLSHQFFLVRGMRVSLDHGPELVHRLLEAALVSCVQLGGFQDGSILEICFKTRDPFQKKEKKEKKRTLGEASLAGCVKGGPHLCS